MSSGANQSRWAWAGAIAIIIATAGSVFWPEHRLRTAATASVGLSEPEVIAKLGAPFSVVTAAQARASPQWWGPSWHPAPNRPVTNKVLLYYASITGALIYVGATGKVEHVHLLGT